MNYGADAADQVMRISLNGVEVAAKLSGKAAERLAVLLYTILKEQKKTAGKIRLSSMIKSGKELKVFAVKDTELQRFCEEAKKYGVLYCVLKDTKANDGLTDIMVRAEDASKIARICERFGLANIDMATVKTEIAKDKSDDEGPIETVERNLDKYLDDVVSIPEEEQEAYENPSFALTAKSSRSEPTSQSSDNLSRGTSVKTQGDERPSVRQALKDIREEMEKKADTLTEKAVEQNPIRHIPVPVKRVMNKEAR